MNRFDIAQGKEPEDEGGRPQKPNRPSSTQTHKNTHTLSRVFFIRGEGGEEIMVHAQDFNIEFYQTPQGPEMFVNMSFPMTREQSNRLLGRS